MSRLHFALVRGIGRVGPAVKRVIEVLDRIKIHLPVWLHDRQKYPCIEIGPGDDGMDMHAALGFRIIVPYRGPRITGRVETRKCDALVSIEHLIDLLGRWVVVRRPSDQAMQMPVFKLQTVDDLAGELRVAA